MHLDVGDGHRIYIEDCGAEQGVPAVFIHGGPGSSCKPYHRQFFHPEHYRTVLFDQRGCGRSQPPGLTRNNSTPDLVADIERIREALEIERWVVFGGSWGATLGLLYAQAHPERVLGMILRGCFLARHRDLEWFMGAGGARQFFPEHWLRFIEAVPEAGNGAVIDVCHRLITDEDPVIREHIARAWANWANCVVCFSLDSGPAEEAGDTQELISTTAIEIHYAAHRYFVAENQILDEIEKLPRVPVTLVHGRRDLTCVPESSWSLHRAIPGSRLHLLQRSGHLASEAATVDALVQASDEMLDLIK